MHAQQAQFVNRSSAATIVMRRSQRVARITGVSIHTEAVQLSCRLETPKGRQLNHHDADQCFGGIDPDERISRAAPTICALAARTRPITVEKYSHTEAEPVAL